MRIDDPEAVARLADAVLDCAVPGFVASLDVDEPQEPGPYELPLRCRCASSIFITTKV